MLGILIGIISVLALGRFKKQNLSPLFLLFFAFIGFTILLAIGLGFIFSGTIVASSLGAVFGGSVLFLVLPQLPKKQREITSDIILSSALLALMITRIGCIFGECDFGAPTNITWGIQYASPGKIWQYHLLLGIQEGHLSHAVHPFPWLIALPGVLLFFFVWLKNLSNKTEWIVLGYLAIRFIAEFFRDPITSISIFWVQVSLAFGALVFIIFFHAFRKKFF